MPAQKMLQYTCERCGHAWLEVAPEDETTKTAAPPALTVEYVSKEGHVHCSYDVLCETCDKAIQGYLKNVMSGGRGTALRGRKREKVEETPPTPPPLPPRATPPQTLP